jgi:hypothetical protein
MVTAVTLIIIGLIGLPLVGYGLYKLDKFDKHRTAKYRTAKYKRQGYAARMQCICWTKNPYEHWDERHSYWRRGWVMANEGQPAPELPEWRRKRKPKKIEPPKEEAKTTEGDEPKAKGKEKSTGVEKEAVKA